MNIIKTDKGKSSKRSSSLQYGKKPRLVQALHSVLTSDKSFNLSKPKCTYNNNRGKCSRITVNVFKRYYKQKYYESCKVLYEYEILFLWLLPLSLPLIKASSYAPI